MMVATIGISRRAAQALAPRIVLKKSNLCVLRDSSEAGGE
jgi:hypothetical protein